MGTTTTPPSTPPRPLSDRVAPRIRCDGRCGRNVWTRTGRRPSPNPRDSPWHRTSFPLAAGPPARRRPTGGAELRRSLEAMVEEVGKPPPSRCPPFLPSDLAVATVAPACALAASRGDGSVSISFVVGVPASRESRPMRPYRREAGLKWARWRVDGRGGKRARRCPTPALQGRGSTHGDEVEGFVSLRSKPPSARHESRRGVRAAPWEWQ